MLPMLLDLNHLMEIYPSYIIQQNENNTYKCYPNHLVDKEKIPLF